MLATRFWRRVSFRSQLDHALAQRGYALDPRSRLRPIDCSSCMTSAVDYKAQRSQRAEEAAAPAADSARASTCGAASAAARAS